MNSNEGKSSKTKFAYFLLIIGVIAPLILFILLSNYNNQEIANIATYITSPMAAFFSLAGVFFFIAALSNQKEELKLQRKDIETQIEVLNLQREEMVSTRKVFEQQNKTLLIQRFENTFFNLLNNFNKQIESIIFEQSHNKWNGRSVFEIAFGNLKNIYDNDSIHRAANIMNMGEIYETFFKKYEHILSTYIGSLFCIIKFIDGNNNINEDEKPNYIDFLKSQLSKYEVLLIIYHLLSKFQTDELEKLMKKYKILENYNKCDLISEKHSAFVEQKIHNI